jgi:hypothetical protein
MEQEGIREEAVRRNISLYQVKKERNDNRILQLDKMVESLRTTNQSLREKNIVLEDTNKQLHDINDILTNENERLKLEVYSVRADISDNTTGFIPIQNILNDLSTDADTTEFSIPDNFVRLMYS